MKNTTLDTNKSMEKLVTINAPSRPASNRMEENFKGVNLDSKRSAKNLDSKRSSSGLNNDFSFQQNMLSEGH